VGGPAAPPECAGWVAGGAGAAGTAPAPGAFAWRTQLDLEHSICYNVTNHWSALVGDALTPAGGGHRVKYVFLAFFPGEQLFDLTADPQERVDLAADAAWRPELLAWRGALASQFAREGRGPAWVSPAGELQRRAEGQLCSPNFPDRSFC